MASFWFWLFTIIISAFVGIIGTIILWFLGTFLKDIFWSKFGIPRNKKKLSNYIQSKNEKFLYPGKPEEIKREVKEANEQRERHKFREFEKLRREELKRRREAGNPTNTTALPKRSVLQNEPNTNPKLSDPGSSKSSRKVKLD